MKFINKGKPIKIRFGEPGKGCYWKTLAKNEIIDLQEETGKMLDLEKVKTTEGQLGNEKVETKQIEVNPLNQSEFFNELRSIVGIGKKTAKDIVKWGNREKLIHEIKIGKILPFRDDIEIKLRRKYGRINN